MWLRRENAFFNGSIIRRKNAASSHSGAQQKDENVREVWVYMIFIFFRPL